MVFLRREWEVEGFEYLCIEYCESSQHEEVLDFNLILAYSTSLELTHF